MPSLVVYIDEQPVTLELEDGDDLTSVACILEEMHFDINPAFPEIMVAGKNISDVFERVNFHTTYKFGKCSFIFVCCL